MYGLKREIYTAEDAINKGTLVDNLSFGFKHAFGHKLEIQEKLNAYPCNTGMIAQETQTRVTIGMALSHALLCHFLNENTWQIMLTRDVQTSKGGPFQIDDFSYSKLEMIYSMEVVKT
jgi:hypothetical protein